MKTIKKIFIANRGEICRRVALTAKRMGIRTVCLSESKPSSFLMEVIDEFIFVDEETVSLYLNADKMVQFALDVGADAVHPGYGFLSENENFAQKVLDAKLIWLGPSPQAIAAMAHKSDARKLALKLGIPCISGHSVPADMKEAKLKELADSIGYPVLLKAAKGGGGKGMRIAESASELWAKAQEAFSEAKNYFADGTLLLERYIAKSRHIEVQILGDTHGHRVTLGDRDCSLQRRYQKILEEAPALGLTEKTREDLYRYALKLSDEVDYSSCGTVEFLLDWTEASQKKERQDFYFLEMNTRLQVEHPVTESVFGLDLVEWQIRVARGEKLPKEFQSLKAHGHAMELRIYAEDPEKNFFPSPGKVYTFLPAQGPGIRWDHGIDTVDEITTKFDPMIAKLIAFAHTRDAAIDRLKEALRQTFFAGPVNNVNFLENVLQDSEFRKGPIDTSFLKSKTFHSHANTAETAFADALLSQLEAQNGSFEHFDSDSKSDLKKKSLSIFSKKHKSHSHNETFTHSYEVHTKFPKDPRIQITYGRGLKSKTAFFYASARYNDFKIYFIKCGHFVFSKKHEKIEIAQVSTQSKQQHKILSPVPGRILKVLVQNGDTVQAQQTLFVLDSMKMEFVISSQESGKIEGICIREGDQVESGQNLAEFKAHT